MFKSNNKLVDLKNTIHSAFSEINTALKVEESENIASFNNIVSIVKEAINLYDSLNPESKINLNSSNRDCRCF